MQSLPDDVLIHICSWATIADILSLRLTCRHFHAISLLRAVWYHACLNHVISLHLPFPTRHINRLSSAALEALTRRSLRLGSVWADERLLPVLRLTFEASPSVAISDVKFLPGMNRWPNYWLATVSKGIWSEVVCWDVSRLSDRDQTAGGTWHAEKLATWSSRGAIFTGFVVNEEERHESLMAVSVAHESTHMLYVLGLDGEGPYELKTAHAISTDYKPILLRGGLLAMSDNFGSTKILDLTTGRAFFLQSLDREGEDSIGRPSEYNRCHQVVMTPEIILVVRARSLEVFPSPHLEPGETGPPTEDICAYHPLASHSFGWVDGICVAPLPDPLASFQSEPNLAAILRAESDDPWSSDLHTIRHFPIRLSLDQSGESDSGRTVTYTIPSRPSAQLTTHRGVLRCRTLLLGEYGTSLWIQPSAPAHVGGLGLTRYDIHASEVQAPFALHNHTALGDGSAGAAGFGGKEVLVGAVFSGAMSRSEPRAVPVCANWGSSWTALDYDEQTGRIALGDASGQVAVMEI